MIQTNEGVYRFFLQNTLRSAQELRGKTNMQVASARIMERGHRALTNVFRI